MLILGIIDSKPASAVLVDGGRPVAAIAEERLCRWKMAQGMPVAAIAGVLEEAGVGPEEIGAVAVGQRVGAWHPRPEPWSDWFQATSGGGFAGLGSALAPWVGRFGVSHRLHHALKARLHRGRHGALPALLETEHGITAPVRFYDHHLCHAAGAYYACELEPALVVTLDGGGDGRSGAVYRGEGGRLVPLASFDSYHSLGNLYSYATALCGFRAERDEGKITGLAALGEPRYAEILRRFVTLRDGRPRYRVAMYHRSALERLRRALPADFEAAHLAASIQLLLEETVVELVRYWLRRSGLGKLAVAGGVFANVKLNQRLHELEEVEHLFVQPAMDDSGLSLGAAWLACPESPKARLEHLFLGRCYSRGEIEAALRHAGLRVRPMARPAEEIAELLAAGAVVARFHGAFELGPRALGHRSILYTTTEPSVNRWLNERLRRTEFMPFAPATLAEEAPGCYRGLEAAADAARFMTVTFDCTESMRRASPGVVHVDGTARPQVVDRGTAPDFHDILSAYHRLTGIPSLVNTSFNLHGEPVVASPADAVRSFLEGHLDVLVMEDLAVEHPRREKVTKD